MKKGFTLIEMLVTVGLFAIVITIAVGGFLNAERTQGEVSSLISAQSNVSLALEQVSRDVRTGYLFCHKPGDNSIYDPSPLCDDVNNTVMPTCRIDAASSTWTCPSLDFYDAEGNHINYSSAGGALTESINSSTPQAITSAGVLVKYLQFQLFGQEEGDHWTPRITISLGITASSTDPAVTNDVFNLETSVSARTIDCVPVPNTDPAQC